VTTRETFGKAKVRLSRPPPYIEPPLYLRDVVARRLRSLSDDYRPVVLYNDDENGRISQFVKYRGMPSNGIDKIPQFRTCSRPHSFKTDAAY